MNGAAPISISIANVVSTSPVQKAVDHNRRDGSPETMSAGWIPKSLNAITRNRNGAAIWTKPNSSGVSNRVRIGRVRMVDAIRATVADIVQTAPLATRCDIGAATPSAGVWPGGEKGGEGDMATCTQDIQRTAVPEG